MVAMGRFGGTELAYASDLDVLVVFDDTKIPAEEAESTAEALLKLVSGETPVQRLYDAGPVAAARGAQGLPGPEPQGVRGLLRTLGAGLGTPGPDPGALRRRRPRRGPSASANWPAISSGARRSRTTTSWRSAG